MFTCTTILLHNKMKEKVTKKAETPKDSRYYFGLINLEN